MNLEDKEKEELIKMLTAAKPDLDEFTIERLSWKNLPFNPEDLMFKEYTQEDYDHGLLRVYTRDGITCMRLDANSNWVVKTEDAKMTFNIKSKFHAYQLFKMIGLDMDPLRSSVPDLDRPIAEILGKSEEE